MDQIEAALPLFRTALEVNPNIEKILVSYIYALVIAKRLEEAKQAIKKAKEKGLILRTRYVTFSHKCK